MRHSDDSTLTDLLTAESATYRGIRGQPYEGGRGKGLGGGSTRLMEHIRGIRRSKHLAGECRNMKKKSAFGESDEGKLTMLRPHLGPTTCAAALQNCADSGAETFWEQGRNWNPLLYRNLLLHPGDVGRTGGAERLEEPVACATWTRLRLLFLAFPALHVVRNRLR